MTGKVINSGATGFLVLILPIALTAVVVATAWPVLLALLLIIIIWQIAQQWRWQRFVKQVNPTFKQLIQENNGCLTPVDLAMKANIEGNQAQKFLEYKATEFSAKSREIPNQGRVYYFLTASAVQNFFEEPESLEEVEEEEGISSTSSAQQARETNPIFSSAEVQTATLTQEEEDTSSLIQAEMARRLNVHSSTVGRRKSDPDFSEWTRQRDPENISWQYSPESNLFYPLEE
ncbi:MAG: hypothetical protein ACLFRN_02425 [Halothece sp.]